MLQLIANQHSMRLLHILQYLMFFCRTEGTVVVLQ